MLKNSMIIYVISTNVMYLPTHNIANGGEGNQLKSFLEPDLGPSL